MRFMRAYSIFTIPPDVSTADRMQRRRMLARLGLAWLMMMQVMTLAFPGYLRSDSMRPDTLETLNSAIYLMNWTALLLTVPVMMYCAIPIWKGAWDSLRHAKVGMDVPVALGILVAFIPSVYTTWTGEGEVYFDSVTMFVAFLLTARYLELCARQSTSQGEAHKQLEQLRLKLTNYSNKLAFWFVSIQVVLAIVLGFVWFYYKPAYAIAVVVALFVMSCPCALSMAVPTAVASAQAGVNVQPPTAAGDLASVEGSTTRISKQNLYGSIAWHLLMTPLAAVGLVAPWVAAISMLVSSLIVAYNSWRIYKRRSKQAAQSLQRVMG